MTFFNFSCSCSTLNAGFKDSKRPTREMAMFALLAVMAQFKSSV